MKKYRVITFLRKSIKDNQGEAIRSACNTFGLGEIIEIRSGQCHFIECSDDTDVEGLCKKLLANPVMEDYIIEEE
jgi:phosphoribosylformylglycinamidine synthase